MSLTRPLATKRIVFAAALVCLGGGSWLARRTEAFRPDYWLAIVHTYPVSAPALFVPAYALAVTVLLPTLPLNLVAGALWGPGLGSALAFAGSLSGAVLAFLLARGACGQPLARRVDAKFVAWLQQQFARHGWKVIAFVRLNPIFPGPVNFLFGLTSIRFVTYLWSSALFLLPPCVAFAAIGSWLGAIVLRGAMTDLRSTLLLVGASLLFVLLCAILLRARFMLRQEPTSDTCP